MSLLTALKSLNRQNTQTEYCSVCENYIRDTQAVFCYTPHICSLYVYAFIFHAYLIKNTSVEAISGSFFKPKLHHIFFPVFFFFLLFFFSSCAIWRSQTPGLKYLLYLLSQMYSIRVLNRLLSLSQ